jgi:hypothetical protein|tara:strand:+ start:171 stop:428 length:258 start_codon:yes stop_codon:yes gene_type:complete
MDIQHVTPNENASRRTKNRLVHLKAGGLMAIHRCGHPTCFDGRMCVLVEQLGVGGWIGWIPVDEVNIEEDAEFNKRFIEEIEEIT